MFTRGLEVKDSDIIIQAGLGNKGAYRELLRKYANLALAVAYARSGNRETARLAAADSFVEAAKELASLPETALISPWLASIVRGAVAKRMSGSRRASLTLEAAREKIEEAVNEGGGPAAIGAEAKNELALTAFSALTDEAREVLCLRHIYSSNYSDIASGLATEASEADKQIAAARETLATVLEPLYRLA